MNPDAILRRGRRPAPVLWQQAWARINAGKRRYGTVKKGDVFGRHLDNVTMSVASILLSERMLRPR